MRSLNVKGWGTLAAVAVLIAVVIAALASSTVVRGPRPPAPADVSLNASLSRCHDLGLAAENDPTCHQTWRRLSERFLGQDLKAAGHE